MEASRALAPAPRALLRPKPSADKAFEQLYERHARDVYQYALALLTNPADAEDVTQTTFLNAYRALQRGDRPHRPHNWLITIAHNVCRMRWRQAGHRPREVALDAVPEPVALEHEQPSLDDVLGALSRLSFNQRSALVMRELEGRSCKEIAETLGLTVSAVEALLFRARRRLQIERKALGVLGTAPLPGSLASALGIGGGGGGGAIATGLTALGSDAALKAATALVAASLIGAGAIAVTRPTGAYHPATPPAATHTKSTHKAPAATHVKRARAHRHVARRASRTTAPPAHAGSRDSSSGTVVTLPPAVPVQPPVQLPRLPVPPPPVQLPPVQLPQLPVQVPPLPPPPPLPPL